MEQEQVGTSECRHGHGPCGFRDAYLSGAHIVVLFICPDCGQREEILLDAEHYCPHHGPMRYDDVELQFYCQRCDDIEEQRSRCGADWHDYRLHGLRNAGLDRSAMKTLTSAQAGPLLNGLVLQYLAAVAALGRHPGDLVPVDALLRDFAQFALDKAADLDD